MSKEIADRLEAWRNGLDRQSRLDLRDVTRIDEFIAALRATTPPPPPDAPVAGLTLDEVMTIVATELGGAFTNPQVLYIYQAEDVLRRISAKLQAFRRKEPR